MINKITSKIQGYQNKIDTLNTIKISKSAILNNFNIFQKLNKDFHIFPVLKSNAYGHGIIQLASILKPINLELICVDSYFEYLKIKDIINCETLTIGYNKPNNYKLYNFKKLSITIYDIESLKILNQLNRKIKIHLKIDTGMNRHGIQIYEIKNFLQELIKSKKIILDGVYTHLADADNFNNILYTNEQIKKFKISISIIKSSGFNPKYIHIANSAGAVKINEKEFNSVRLGLGLYGYNPLNENDKYYSKLKLLKPSLRMISTVIQSKNIQFGAKISYNLTYVADEDKRIGIIPAGYYEGIDRRLSNIGFFTYNSHNLRILGRVCMNLCVVDLTNTPVEQGNNITLINNKINSINSVANISKLCNTIPYIITTKLSESVRRIIVK